MSTFSWRVEATIPFEWKSGQKGTKNLNLQVVASSLKGAIAVVEATYPDVTFIKVMRDRHIDDVLIEYTT